MKSSVIVYFDGIVQVKRTKGGYRVEVADNMYPHDSLQRAAACIARDCSPPPTATEAPMITGIYADTPLRSLQAGAKLA